MIPNPRLQGTLWSLSILALWACRSPLPPLPAASAGLPQGQGQLPGVDPNGRIPRIEVPDDLPNPERWRYKPRGRISDGSVLDRFMTSTFIAPILFSSNDVGTGAGIALTDIDFRNRRRREFASSAFTYTSEGQQRYSFFWRRWLDHRDLPGGGVLQEERSFLQAFVGYRKTLTRRFFGLGPDTPDSAESSYSDEATQVEFGVDKSLPEPGSEWVLGVGLRLEHRNLSGGFVNGADDTAEAFPELFGLGDDLDSLWLRGDLRYDTRDSPTNPYRGAMVQAWADGIPWFSGGRSGARYGLRGSWVVPVPGLLHDGGAGHEENPPTDRLAFALAAEASSGDLPFWALPSLGGGRRLRGYIAGRFVDRCAWFSAAEYRFVLLPRGLAYDQRIRLERLGLALFYELGSVAPDVGSLAAADVKSSYGISARFHMERSATFRADLGFAPNSTNWTVTFGLSF